jgi:CCR4-NOT transcription complex subunit 7/8
LVFAENLISSGMVINDDIKWITFHGAFDFAYLVKCLTNEHLPQTLEQFLFKCKQYFPVMYDTKIIAAEMDDIKGNSL